MSPTAQVQTEIEKAASMVSTARRLLATGTTVDLSALEGKIRFICETLAEMEAEDGRPMVPGMESLVADLDRLETAIRDRLDPESP